MISCMGALAGGCGRVGAGRRCLGNARASERREGERRSRVTYQEKE